MRETVFQDGLSAHAVRNQGLDRQTTEQNEHGIQDLAVEKPPRNRGQDGISRHSARQPDIHDRILIVTRATQHGMQGLEGQEAIK
jgi:hypothetical protein